MQQTHLHINTYLQILIKHLHSDTLPHIKSMCVSYSKYQHYFRDFDDYDDDDEIEEQTHVSVKKSSSSLSIDIDSDDISLRGGPRFFCQPPERYRR